MNAKMQRHYRHYSCDGVAATMSLDLFIVTSLRQRSWSRKTKHQSGIRTRNRVATKRTKPLLSHCTTEA
uniref:Uncharacterized protein n=1 Tax=Acrobeloides nanus TaxID=290746 RepID=A0A914CSP5_9BILA